MKRLSPLFLSLIALCALPLQAAAQQAKKDVPPPPRLEKLEEGDPAVTIRPNEGKQITERREQGKVKEVQVQTGGSKYTVRANEQPGSIQPGEGGAGNSRPAQWQLMEFDLGMKKKKDETKSTSDDKAHVPPPPASASPK